MNLAAPFQVQRQGDFHVEYVNVADRRPGFRRWYIGTEEKRPDGIAMVLDRRLIVLVWNRTDNGEVQTIHYRENQTGEESTSLYLHLPRPLPWRRWEVSVMPEKWGVEVLAWTTSWPVRPIERLQWWVRTTKKKGANHG